MINVLWTKKRTKPIGWTRIQIMILIAAMLTINLPIAAIADAAVFSKIIYVDDSAATGGDGTSWAMAYKDLQSALGAAVAGDQIWVASGVYKPTDGAERDKVFNMPFDISVYGGFVGDEPSDYDVTLRDWETNATILSGDIGVAGDASDNSYHVVQIGAQMYPVSSALVLDGLTITAGHANGSMAAVYDRGAGILCFGDPILKNLIIDSNTADNSNSNYSISGGGGVFLEGNPVITNVVFANNIAIHDSTTTTCGGGGLYIYWGKPVLRDVVFSANSAKSYGGAIYVNDDSIQISMTHVQCIGNTARNGGAFYIGNIGLARMENVEFLDNSSQAYGGAIYIQRGSIQGINTLFSGNRTESSGSFGGGVAMYGGSIDFTNATITNNSTNVSGGGVFVVGGSASFSNSIFWGNIAETSANEIYSAISTSVSYSNIDSAECYNISPVSSINADPLFEDAAGGDYHLQPESPCIDTGSNAPFEIGGIAVNIAHDLDGNARLVDGDMDTLVVVDMGAYEFQVGDAVPPDTLISTYPASITNSDAASFTWTGSDNATLEENLLFSYKLDDGEWSVWDAGSSVNFSSLSEEAHQMAVKAKDEAGNEDPTPAECFWTIDLTNPAAAISTTADNPTSVSSIPVTAVFSEGVTGFALEDIDVSNGTAVDLSGSGQEYTFSVTPIASGAVSIVLPAGIVQDATGNPNTVSNTINILYQPPVYSADLSTLSVSSGTLDPLFDPDITEYQVNVARNKKSIWITAITEDPSAVMTINGESIIRGDPYLMDLVFGENYVVIEVTPQDGAAAKTYTITITRTTDRPEKPNKPGKPK